MEKIYRRKILFLNLVFQILDLLKIITKLKHLASSIFRIKK